MGDTQGEGEASETKGDGAARGSEETGGPYWGLTRNWGRRPEGIGRRETGRGRGEKLQCLYLGREGGRDRRGD